jgi:magnesium-transporting ATPase (P-type)
MLWINLIMDTFASLALSTEKPHKDILNGKPEGRNSYLINRGMFKFIFVHSIWQLFVSLFLLFEGRVYLV